MIPIPICLTSKQHCNCVCIHSDCNQSPFICSYCQNYQCRNVHQHNGNLIIKKWTEIASLVEYYLKQKYPSQKILHSLDKKQQTSNQYIIKCLQNRQCSNIVGKSLSSLYNSLIKYSNTQKQEKQFQPIYKQKQYQEQMMVDSIDLQEFYFNEGQQKFQQGEYQGAFESFEKVIKINKNNHKSYVYLKNITAKLQKQEQFIFKYSQQINRDPLNPINYLKRGRLYFEMQNYDDSLRDYDKAIQLDQIYSVAYQFRAFVYYSTNKYQQAKLDIQKAIQLNPKYQEAYYNRAFLYCQKQKQLALKDYTTVIQINPSYYDAFNNRGILYYQKMEIQKALNDYNKAIELDPHNYRAYNNRALVYQWLSKVELALEGYNKAIQLNPQYIDAYNNRGLIYKQKKQYDAAMKDYNKAIQLNPNYLKGYYNRALIYKQLNQLEMAIKDMNKVLQLHYSPKYLFIISKLYFDLSNYQLSKAHFSKRIELDGENYRCYYFLGRIELQKRNLELSVKYFQTSIQIAQYIPTQCIVYKGIVKDLMQEEDQANDAYEIGFNNDEKIIILKQIYKKIRRFQESNDK